MICTVASVTDGDTIRCAEGTRIRIAGIQAPDRQSSRPCRLHDLNYQCDDRAYARSKAIVTRLVLHKRLPCTPVDRSYKRIVATCHLPDKRDLSCAIIASGAAVRWDLYWIRYRMGRCS
jgi:endonuclease YncB( thermonuclease family)